MVKNSVSKLGYIIGIIICIILISIIIRLQYSKYVKDKEERCPFEYKYQQEAYDKTQNYQTVHNETKDIYGISYHSGNVEGGHFKPVVIMDQFFVDVKYKGERKTYYDKEDKNKKGMLVENNIEQFNLDCISFKTGEVEKSIDMKALLEEYIDRNDYLEDSIYHSYMDYSVRIGDKSYLRLYFCEKPKDDEVWQEISAYSLLFDIEKEAFIEKEELEICGTRYWNSNESFLELNNMKELERRYISFKEVSLSRLEVSILSVALPDNNEKLYQLFPELKGVNQNDDFEILDLYIPIDETPTTLDILEYFVEDEVGIRFDGFTLDARESIDGQEHYIESREQFEQYYNGYWENGD